MIVAIGQSRGAAGLSCCFTAAACWLVAVVMIGYSAVLLLLLALSLAWLVSLIAARLDRNTLTETPLGWGLARVPGSLMDGAEKSFLVHHVSVWLVMPVAFHESLSRRSQMNPPCLIILRTLAQFDKLRHIGIEF
jgi:hypothetical protein